MKDSLDTIIYVGKSKNLKSRVSSYFTNSKSHSPKVVKLVKNLKDFDYIITDTEFEAFMLECKLIKEIKPIYNKLMKSPISYSYIKIALNSKYPEIYLSDTYSINDGNMYFGPYTSSNKIERALLGLKEHYKILCSNKFKSSSACINYSLGLCMGICMESFPKDSYLSTIDKIISLLKGNNTGVIEEIEYKMLDAVNKLEFEAAAKYRDYIQAINYIVNRTNMINYMELNRNIMLIENLDKSSIKFFLIKDNKVIFNEKFSLLPNNQLVDQLIKITLEHFSNVSLNNSICFDKNDIDEAQIIFSYIQNKSNNCRYSIINTDSFSIDFETNINRTISNLLALNS
ncbi:excinuclease ABC subunit C [Clostridium folliculivorans]|uniref:Excinuclease ABC subunit C n=2 Tax=Clostridium folliculivorans TaxID=2886038 RepID=A0A9W6DC16_9CLOT|nr:excinuclease ABC subunit C [Clostridium folliculivorans]GKU29061.1 excinuclease ABC subunit C [Clostridium folliculivorans]